MSAIAVPGNAHGLHRACSRSGGPVAQFKVADDQIKSANFGGGQGRPEAVRGPDLVAEQRQ